MSLLVLGRTMEDTSPLREGMELSTSGVPIAVLLDQIMYAHLLFIEFVVLS